MEYPFWYIASIASTLTNGSIVDISVVTAQNTNFIWQALRADTDLDAETDFAGAIFEMKITDNGTGQLFVSDYIPRRAICGSIEKAETGILPIPITLAGGTTITFSIKNTSGSSFTRLQLVMVGIRQNA